MINRSNDNNYHWDYEDYQGNYGQSPARGKKNSNRGLRVFLIMMGAVVLLVGALCIGAAVWGSRPAPKPDQDPSIGNELEVGEMVVAIGNPGGLALASTQTVGYISAVKRTITTELGYTMVCIQADAAINPGNSGGPLINTYGQVVGITSSKLVEEGYEGIGFSIPINTALPILDDLMQHGRVTGRAQLGITVVEVSSSEASYYGIPMGLQIRSINEDSDVGRQGAEVGDIITSIDGWAITSRTDCSDILAQHQPGDTVEISLYRASRTGRGQTFTITVTLLGS